MGLCVAKGAATNPWNMMELTANDWLNDAAVESLLQRASQPLMVYPRSFRRSGGPGLS